METLQTNNTINHSTKNFLKNALLASVLSLWISSCWEITQKDIKEQKDKVELLSLNISHYIDARKKLADEYNTIYNYPRTETNQYEINNHLQLLARQIQEYDEKIEYLIGEKINAENDLTIKKEYEWAAWILAPVDPDIRDYLLKDK